MSTDVATNPNQGSSDPKSDLNKPQDQAGSGTDDPKQVNGKSVVGKSMCCFLSITFRRRIRFVKTTTDKFSLIFTSILSSLSSVYSR